MRAMIRKDPRLELTDVPDGADLTIEIAACRVVKRANDRSVETVDLIVSAGTARAELQGEATRSLAPWRDAARHALDLALRWLDHHSAPDPLNSSTRRSRL